MMQIVLIVLIGGGLGIIATINSTNALSTQLEEQLSSKVQDNKKYLEERFQRSFTELEALAANDVMSKMTLEGQLRYLDNELQSLNYLTFAIVRPDGTAHYIDGTTAELGDRDYVIKAFEGHNAMSDVIESRVTNEMVMMLATPIVQFDNIIGVLIARVDGFYLSEIIDEIKFGATGHAFVLNEEGTILAHGDRTLVEEQVNYLNESGIGVNTATRIVEEESGTFFYNNGGVRQYSAFETLENGWTLVVGADEKEFSSSINQLQIILGSSVIVALIIGLVLSFIFATSISKPIQVVTENGNKLANGDFTVKIPKNLLARKDEVGNLSKTFVTLTTNMRSMLQQVHASAQQVEKAIEEMTKRTEATTMITSKTNQLISHIETAAETQLKSAKDGATAIHEMAEGTEKVALIAAEVSETSNEIQQHTNEGEELIQRSVMQMNNIGKGSQITYTTIHQLQDTSKQVNEITQIISDIADQTNLLALNATIEAARAGEAGKGFAVVADEIRKLSEQTASSALEINELIKAIQIGTTSAVETVEKGQQDVDQGIQLMTQLSGDFSTIFGYLNGIHGQMNELSALAEEMSSGTEEVSSGVEESIGLTGETTKKIREVTGQVSEQNRMMDEINDAMSILERTAQQLKDSVEKFKV